MKGDDVQRDLVLKGETHQAGRKRYVNHVSWARQAAQEQECQNRVDAKALTGRGGLADLRQKIDSLDAIVLKMRQLSEKSKNVAGLGFYLMLHQRNASGYVFLRWRARLGVNRHLSWQEAEDLAAGYPSNFYEWCMEASRQAKSLNDEHLEMRAEIKKARKRVERVEPHIYPRSKFPV
ncbi:hypothetical protein [Alicycliphilus denitrificans]|uniref:hypothetical protein n=1 Tax=Alicycliphilus denitrificans TaxID=179636 RepID=UPI00384D87C7